MAAPGTLGMPGFVPSNTTGQPGVSQGQMGRLGSGVLQTIEEGQGAFSSEVMYYDKSVGYYQLPQVQRSHGDDIRTINITNFGARGTVTLPRKFFNFGPSYLRFRLTIDYAWAGCEYVLNTYNSTTETDALTTLGMTVAAALTDASAPKLVRYSNMAKSANGNVFGFESSGSDTMLPTSFQSGGMAFAFPAQIEMNLGGAGQITIDRYANWALIMASTPFIQGRKDLMRMAGGGLNLNDPNEARQAPVRWGRKPWMCAAGYTDVQIPLCAFGDKPVGADGATVYENSQLASITATTIKKTKIVPVEWDVLLPIKTPETNFMYALTRRKPLDTSILAGDMQLTFTWSNFNEWTDTGKGFPNAPVYYTQSDPAVSGGTIGGATGYRPPFTGSAPLGYQIAAPDTQFISPLANEIGAPLLVHSPLLGAISAANATSANIDAGLPKMQMISCVAYNPVVWTNHYRVADGIKLVADLHFVTNTNTYYFSSDDGTRIATIPGRPRYPQYAVRGGNNAKFFCSNQLDARTVNDAIVTSYPTKFNSIEYINSSLKLTNPALGARNALMTDKEAVVYYPFQYAFTQIYSKPSVYKNYTNWNSTTLAVDGNNLLQDLYADQNKHTVMIQMPANPCTSMLVSIFREKDRQTLVSGKRNSYSPVLFWNALNPERMVLKDGGNVLFEFFNSIDHELYSMMDRPDALKIPFRGGHCKVQPSNLYGNRHIPTSAVNIGGLRFIPPTSSDDALANAFNTTPAWPDYIPETVLENARVNPFWYVGSAAGAVAGIRAKVGVGYQGTNTGIAVGAIHPAGSVNAFPADELCNSVALNAGCKQFQPCHTTEWYEATIMEFPFVMNEPIVNEKIVQNTPSFAKTQLQLDFWINPKLKPDNGMDDMYDSTYGLTRAFPNGVGAVSLGNNLPGQKNTQGAIFSFPSPGSHPVPHCLHEKAEPESGLLAIRDKIGSMAAGAGLSSRLTFDGKYADGFTFTTANSWNINNGNLMVHVTFCQNQVWALSPLRTSLFSARG